MQQKGKTKTKAKTKKKAKTQTYRVSFDWRDNPRVVFEELIPILSRHGIVIKKDPEFEKSDTMGFVIGTSKEDVDATIAAIESESGEYRIR